MKHNILLSALLAAMLVIAGSGGGGSSGPPITGTTMAQLDKAVMELEAAVAAGNIDTPTQALIDAIDREIRELQTAIDNAADGVVTTAATTALNTAMTTRGTINTRFAALPDPTEVDAGQLAMAVMELEAAVMAGNIDTPTQALIDAIDREIRELQAAIDNAAEGVDTTAAARALTTARTTRGTINTRFDNLPDPNAMLANRPTTEIEYDATANDGNGRWTIDISSGLGGASHEVTVGLTHGWISVTSDTPLVTKTGAATEIDEIYAIAVYGKSKDDDANDFDDEDRMGFGAWVSNSGIVVGNTSSVPPLIDGVAASGDDPATGRVYLDAKLAGTTGTATYTGDVAGITESDGDIGNNVYDPQYVPWIGAVELTANLANNTLDGSITGKVGNPIPTDIAFEGGVISNYMASGNINNGQGEDSGDWNARFVHQGRWIVGDFDYQPNGTDTTFNLKTEADSTADPDPAGFTYIRHRGAFGAVEE